MKFHLEKVEALLFFTKNKKSSTRERFLKESPALEIIITA
jgi:hypothetical protein